MKTSNAETETLSKRRVPELMQQPFFGVGVIVLAVALLYGHTLSVPLYLDDTRGLVENFRLRDLPATVAHLFSQRGLTNLTFALNYRLTGWSLGPLHLVNILLHAGCGMLVWRLLLRMLGGRVLPLCGALLFIAHPLQTQGVTYLIQRATVLGAFFFLLAFFLYLRAREALATGRTRSSAAYLGPYLGAVAAGACAVLAKENTVTLPLVLFVWDRLFPLPAQRNWRRTLLELLPFCVVPFLLGAGVLWSLAQGDSARTFVYPIASLQHNSPLHYLVTQFSVIWIYLRLLILPYGQALEHNIPIVAELVTLHSSIALAGLLVLGWGAWRLRRRLPLVAFGVAWFFLALAVESSILPLDPLFEHRLYLPIFGFVLVLLAGAPALLGKRWTWGVLGVALAVGAPLSWQRNALWSDPIAFYEGNMRVAPDSERAGKALATLYEEAGRQPESLRLLESTVKKYPNSYFLYGSLANHYAALGQGERALALLETGMANKPDYAALYEAAAIISKEYGRDMQRAIAYLRRGLAEVGVQKGRLLNTLGLYYSEVGNPRAAEQAFRASLTLPAGAVDRANTYLNLAREYYYQERWQEVFTTLQQVLQLNPGDPQALERLGEMALKLDDRGTARGVAKKLERIDPAAWQRLQRAMRSAGWQERP